MNSFPAWAFAVSGFSAGVGSWAELANKYRRWPFIQRQVAGWWLGIVVLDCLAGVGALFVVSALNLSQHAQWLHGVLGWVVIGLAATLIVRANLLTITVGKTSFPLGFGVIYGLIRSLLEPSLRDGVWAVDFSERQGRLSWSLFRVDQLGNRVSLVHAKKVVRDYVTNVVLVNNPTDQSPQKRLDDVINVVEANDSEQEAVKQLVTFMVEQRYIAPLGKLVGRPSKSELRSWRQ